MNPERTRVRLALVLASVCGLLAAIGVEWRASLLAQSINPTPFLTSISPTSATAGGQGFVLTALGSNFVSSSVIRWNGSDRTTTFVDGDHLRANIPASDIATPGTASVTVFSPGPGGGTSSASTFTISGSSNPVPSINSLSPASAQAGGSGFVLTVLGSNFISTMAGTNSVTSIVRWNGSNRTTTFVDTGHVNANIPASDIATAGTASVTVFNPGPGGGTSNAREFTVSSPSNPVPSLSSLNPTSVAAGGSGFVLTVLGSNFVSTILGSNPVTSIVRWNGSDRNTSFVNSGKLTASIPANDIAVAGTANITVFNPSPGGGISNALALNISDSMNPVPSISSIKPSSAETGSPSFVLTVLGSNFVTNSVVRWRGLDRPTTFVDSRQVTASIAASDVKAAGTAIISVFNPLPGGGTSNRQIFAIGNNPVPTLSNLTPSILVSGGPSFNLTVTGTGFVSTSIIRWNGSDRATTFLSSNRVRAAIPASDTSRPGSATITVFNPAPAGGTSNVLSFRAVNPTAQICCLSPTAAVAAGPAFSLTVFGHSFDPDSSVNWNGSKRTTTFVSSTELRAAIPSSDIASPGSNSVSVSSSEGTTSARSFQVAVLPQGAPIITSLNPAIIPAGSVAFTLQVNGSNFVPASVVQYHGQDRNTTFVSNSMLTATIFANDVRAGSTFNVTVVNPPAAGPNQDGTTGVTGNTAVVVVTNPIPVILGLTPTTATPGSPSVSFNADGVGFVTDVSQVRWNGQPRATTITDTAHLSAQAIASDVTDPGISIVTVSNSGPGGGTSNAMTFTTLGAPIAVKTLYYPRLLSKTGFDNNTGIAITNTGQNAANLTLRALSGGGTEITAPNVANPVSISLSAREQLAKVDSEIFGSGLHDTNKVGWLKVDSTQGNLAGFFLAFNDSVSVLDGAEVSSATLTSIVFPEVENPGFTQIHLVNPNTAATTVTFELYKSDGTLRTPAVSRTISSNGIFAEQLAELFPDITPDASDSLRASSTRGVVALEYLGKATDYAHVLKGQDAATGATTLFSPQFVIGGPWRSTLSVLNLDSSAGNVTLEFIGDNGTLLGSAKTLAVAAKGKIYISDQKFFFDSAGVETTGYVRITSNVRLAGAVVFGDSERATFSAALPLVSTLLSSFIFGHVASNDDYFTGIATLNPSNADVTVTIEVFSRNGDLVQSKTETLPALRRTSRVLTQIFPDLTGQDINSGYIKITASNGLASFAVFGTQRLSALAAIPPQVP